MDNYLELDADNIYMSAGMFYAIKDKTLFMANISDIVRYLAPIEFSLYLIKDFDFPFPAVHADEIAKTDLSLWHESIDCCPAMFQWIKDRLIH